MFRTNHLVRAALALALLGSAGGVGAADAQPAGPPRAPGISVVAPDTVKGSVQGEVPVRPPEPLKVTVEGGKVPDSPWWESNALVALVSALLGAVVGGLIGFGAQVTKANLDIWRRHRDALARMANLSDDYLNDVISNQGRADDAKKAAIAGACFWGHPRPMDVDPTFTTEVFDGDIVTRVATLNADIVRYNRRLEDGLRSHYDLQRARFAKTLSEAEWKAAMENEPDGWDVVTKQLDGLEGLARDVHVRCNMLVRQYDDLRPRRFRLVRLLWRLGTSRVLPLDEAGVDEERRRFDERREEGLKKHGEEMARRYGDAWPRPPRGGT